MSYRVRYTKSAKEDLKRLFQFLLDKDPQTAQRALEAITKSIDFLKDFPFACRKATPENSFLREMLITFGNSGYVALFEIDDHNTVTILAMRHQREDDYE